jgi:hypothetical protein
MSDKKIYMKSLELLLHVSNSHNYMPWTTFIGVANNAEIQTLQDLSMRPSPMFVSYTRKTQAVE